MYTSLGKLLRLAVSKQRWKFSSKGRRNLQDEFLLHSDVTQANQKSITYEAKMTVSY
jgi:hypothetical protein